MHGKVHAFTLNLKVFKNWQSVGSAQRTSHRDHAHTRRGNTLQSCAYEAVEAQCLTAVHLFSVTLVLCDAREGKSKVFCNLWLVHVVSQHCDTWCLQVVRHAATTKGPSMGTMHAIKTVVLVAIAVR